MAEVPLLELEEGWSRVVEGWSRVVEGWSRVVGGMDIKWLYQWAVPQWRWWCFWWRSLSLRFMRISRRRSSSSSSRPHRELNLSSPKMRSMPDSLIFSLSSRRNFSSEGLYLVIERSSARQSYFSEGGEEPEEEEEEEDDSFRGFWRSSLGSALAALAAAAFSARSFSAACSASLRLIFSCLASALATRSFSSFSSFSSLSRSSRSCLSFFSTRSRSFSFSFSLSFSRSSRFSSFLGAVGVGLGLAAVGFSGFSKGLMSLGMQTFFSELPLVWVMEGGGTMGASFLAFWNCSVTFSKVRFWRICSGVMVCSSFHFCTCFLALSLVFSASLTYSWTSSSFFFFLGWVCGAGAARREERKSLASSSRGLAGEGCTLKSCSKSSFSLIGKLNCTFKTAHAFPQAGEARGSWDRIGRGRGGNEWREGGLSVVDELHAEEVSALDLRDVVDDELVVEQRYVADARGPACPAGHQYLAEHLALGGGGLPAALGGLFALGEQVGVVVGVELLIDVAEGDLAEQHESGVVLAGGEAVVGGLGDHVGEVDALPEHVPGHGCLGRGDAQPLAQDTHEVGQPRPVPQQLPVTDLRLEPPNLLRLLELEDVLDLEAVGGVGVRVGVVDVVEEELVGGGVAVERGDAGGEFEVVAVEGVAVAGLLVDQPCEHLDVLERLQHLQLLLDLLLGAQGELRHLPEAEVVWDLGVEVAAEAVDHFATVLALELGHDLLEDGVALEDARLGQLPQWHLVGVVTDLLHLPRHHPHVEDQPDQLLHCRRQRGRWALLLLGFGLLGRLVIGFCVLLVVHLDLFVGLLLFVELLVVVLDCRFLVLVGRLAALSLDSYASPACEEEEIVGGLVLEELDDVEFVVVGFDVGLVEGGCEGALALCVDLVGSGLGEELVDWHCALQDCLLQLLLFLGGLLLLLFLLLLVGGLWAVDWFLDGWRVVGFVISVVLLPLARFLGLGLLGGDYGRLWVFPLLLGLRLIRLSHLFLASLLGSGLIFIGVSRASCGQSLSGLIGGLRFGCVSRGRHE